MSFKDRVKELRTSLNLSAKDFAESLGMSRPAICNYEAGRQNPSEKAIQKIAETYNVSTDWLRGATNENKDEIETAASAVEKAPVGEKKKRGRKKKEVLTPVVEEAPALEEITPAVEEAVPVAEETKPATVEKTEEKPKKRGRKKKEVLTPVVEEAAPVVEEKAPVAEETKPATEEKTATPVVEKKRGRKKKITPVVEAAPALEEIATATVEKTEEKPKKRTQKKTTTPNVIIESMIGGQISVTDILSRLPASVDVVYVKPEENKAYFIINDEAQSIDLW